MVRGFILTSSFSVFFVFTSTGFNRLGGASRLPASAEKAVRQCLHHLTGLQNIWQPVLPSEVAAL